eukprot:6177340-Pleurochrysis_carterae.AAC.1
MARGDQEGPQGFPPLAEFARSVTNARLPRFDPEEARINVNSIMVTLKDRFTDEDRKEWKEFFDNYPKEVEDIPSERLQDRLTGSFMPRCIMHLPDSRGLPNSTAMYLARPVAHCLSFVALLLQEEYSESIRYVNSMSGTSARASELLSAIAEEKEVPVLCKGSIICLLPDEAALQRGAPVGEHLPLWLARVENDEDAPIGAPDYSTTAQVHVW